MSRSHVQVPTVPSEWTSTMDRESGIGTGIRDICPGSWVLGLGAWMYCNTGREGFCLGLFVRWDGMDGMKMV